MWIERLTVLEQLPGIPAPWVVDRTMPGNDDWYTGPCPDGTDYWEVDGDAISLYDENGETLLVIHGVPFIVRPHEIPDPVEDDEEVMPVDSTEESSDKKHDHEDRHGTVKRILGIVGLVVFLAAVASMASYMVRNA